MIEFYAAEPEIARLRSSLLASGAIDRALVLTSLAWHLRQRDSRHAVELSDAAEKALQSGDLNRPDLHRLRARLDLVRAEVAALYTEFDAAAEHLAHASKVYRSLEDMIGVGDAECVAALLARLKGELATERDLWASAAVTYAKTDDSVRAAIAEAWLVLAEIPLKRGGDKKRPIDLTELPLPDNSRAVAALRWAGAGLMSEGTRDAARSATAWTRAYDNAKGNGLVYVATYSALMAARAFRRLGDPDAATSWCERGFDVVRPTGWPHLLGACHMLSGSLFYDLKEMERSHEALTEAIPLSGPHRALCHLFLARTLLALNRPEAALEALDAAGGVDAHDGDPLNQCAMLIERARALARVSRIAEAADQIVIARAIAVKAQITTYDMVILEFLATLHESGYLPLPEGQTSASATYQCLKQALEVGEAIQGWRPTTRLLKRLARAAASVGDPSAAISYFERALDVAEVDTAKRLQNRVAAIQIQEELVRARRDAEFHLQQRRAAIEGRRADELQTALDAMRTAQSVLAERTAEFERLSLLDPLTGIANRRHLEQRASSEIAIILRKSTQLGLVLFDIDRFKGINDAHGHVFGDRVICEVAEIARTQLRPSDFIARVGGEEFTILLPETGLEGGAIIANRIRVALMERPVKFEGIEAVVTASFGVTSLTPADPSLDAAQRRADAALYAAKNSGRNRVCVDGDDRQFQSS